MTKYLLLTTALAVSVQKANSQAIVVARGNDLQDTCKYVNADKTPYDYQFKTAFCAGFLNGITTMLANENKPVVCIPNDVPNKQIMRVILSYLDQHPEKLHYVSQQLIRDALSSAFPCS